ncbi:GTPase Obg [Hydra vulgaris]|uniref:GTPase Obg n=1 Tax=Hydra vulgaris TaxID=6087 RepID=UPI001F5F21D3|nr:GTPase Obg isoform X2 [Hydra vulgaris]
MFLHRLRLQHKLILKIRYCSSDASSDTNHKVIKANETIDNQNDKLMINSEVKRKKKLIFAKGDKKFIDWKRLYLKAGNGGKGSNSFVHSKDHRGGPNGGDGGRGGSVIVVADSSFTQLAHLKSAYHAECGRNGSGRNMHGRNGDDLFIKVPQGSLILKAGTSNIIADLLKDGDSATVAYGGYGGKGNVHFKSPLNVRPREFTEGSLGDELYIDVELKSIADVGLVGFPNAGKSTLLRAISRATPKVADYPFTTLSPNIGIMAYKDIKVTVADIPGLIEGAHVNKGLGHTFLRHIERCSFLLYVLDISVNDPLQQFEILKNELKMYQLSLTCLNSIIVLNKIDLIDHYQTIVENIKNKTSLPVVGVSAVKLENINILQELVKKTFIK